MANEQPSEALFRSTKRRKVLRKPTHQDDTESAATSSATESEQIVTNHQSEDDAEASGHVTRIQKKGAARKLGLGFSSNAGARTNARADSNEELALVPVNEVDASVVLKNERFVKPTGRVGVTDDRHMMAYVDSRLAEARPPSIEPATTSNASADFNSLNAGQHLDQQQSHHDESPEQHSRRTAGETTFQKAQERSRSAYQRPTKRRLPPPRPQTDVARDSMIDQLMGENQVPLYDRSVPQSRADGARDSDNDIAATEEFKSQLLADLERNNKRRPPKTAATATSGPKLGGSRSQREKMRALEEAKTNTGKK